MDWREDLALGVGASLIAAAIIWLVRKIFVRRDATVEGGTTVRQDATPVMTQNFQPTININLPSSGPASTQPAAGAYAASQSTPAMGSATRDLIVEASKDPRGMINVGENLDVGFYVQTNGRGFVDTSDPRSAAAVREALEEARRLRLLEARGDFRYLTAEGYRVADLLKG